MARIKYPDLWTPQYMEALDELFVRARRENLWFFHGGLSGPLWFSPDELQTAQENGKFIWSAENWQLRRPKEAIDELDNQIAALQSERETLWKRICCPAA